MRKSNAFRLQVNSFAPGTLSCQLYVYCSISGQPVPKAQERKTVNFYRFKEYCETVLRMPNFNEWYGDNKYSITFLTTLAQYINHTEGRERLYFPPMQADKMLTALIARAQRLNNEMAQLLKHPVYA